MIYQTIFQQTFMSHRSSPIMAGCLIISRVKLSPDQNCFCGRQCVNFLHYLNECPLLKPLAKQVYHLLPGKVTTVTDKDKINILKKQKILKLIGEMLNLIGAKLGTLERRGLT
ncbi:unnamed protein product [Ixodes pacificus]